MQQELSFKLRSIIPCDSWSKYHNKINNSGQNVPFEILDKIK